jgi:hypothetical protein
MLLCRVIKVLTQAEIRALYKTTDSDGNVIAFGARVSHKPPTKRKRRALTVDDFGSAEWKRESERFLKARSAPAAPVIESQVEEL